MHLTSHLGGAARLERAPRGLRARRAADGHGGRRRRQRRARPGATRLADGRRGRAAGGRRLRLRAASPSTCPRSIRRARRVTPLWRVRGTRGKAFVDFQNDVTDDDVALAEREGFRAVEHLKRYTTLGMATDQGKTSNVDRPGADGGAHRPRPSRRPARPRSARPTRRSPSARSPARIAARTSGRRGCRRRTAGRRSRAPCSSRPALWLRAQWYPRPGETRLARERQPRGARRCASASACAMCRRSARSTCRARTPAEFLDRLYTNTLDDASPSAGRATA